jgi:hypothetical protein
MRDLNQGCIEHVRRRFVNLLHDGIKDSPPYLHDGRLLTLADTVEFFNLVLELKLSEQEKKDLAAFMRAL